MHCTFAFLEWTKNAESQSQSGSLAFSWKRHLIIILISENKEVLGLHIDWGWTAPLGSRRSGGRLTATTEVRCRSRIQLVSRATHPNKNKERGSWGRMTRLLSPAPSLVCFFLFLVCLSLFVAELLFLFFSSGFFFAFLFFLCFALGIVSSSLCWL